MDAFSCIKLSEQPDYVATRLYEKDLHLLILNMILSETIIACQSCLNLFASV